MAKKFGGAYQTIRQMAYYLRKLSTGDNFNAEIRSLLMQPEMTKFIGDLIRAQLYAGVDGTGNDITPYYKMYTVKLKRKKGQISDWVTLRDTGEFYEGIGVDFPNDNEFTITSSDRKTSELVRKYGPEILMLNSEAKARLRRVVAEYLKIKIQNDLKKIK